MGGVNNFFKNKRLITVFVFAGIFVVGIIVMYARLAFMPVRAIPQKKSQSERGSIVDRNGMPLAVQTAFYDVGVSPRQLKDKEEFARNMAPPLEMTAEEIIRKIDTAKSPTFFYLKQKINSSMYDQVKKVVNENGYTFVKFDKQLSRVYPNATLASQLVGYMGKDGKGLAGVEYSKQDLLASGPRIDGSEDAKNIYLTIDANLQYRLEQVAASAMKSTQAESMMLIAAEAKSGEILSYISFPEADLNDYGSASDAQKYDRPAMYAYEPGSVFKIFTVSILHDEGRIRQSDSFLCDGLYEHKIPGGETIRIKCLERHGWLTPRDALRFSCNDALGQISDRISEDEFMDKIRLLGFGSKTGIELPGETVGTVKDPSSKTWSARSKPTIAIGQEISVSALQMVQATTAIANGGVPVQLTVIKKITNKDGEIFYEHAPLYKSRIFKKSTADYILSCMETTATTGTGSRANIRDISIGVKTGTAQMADKEKGGYSDTDYISNCMAIFPIEDPEIILYIVVEKAKGETYSGRIVAPVIAEAADIIIDHLGMSRGGAASLEHDGLITIAKNTSVVLGSTVPDFTGMDKQSLLPLLNRSDIIVNINGSGWVTSQSPAAGTPVQENMVIELNLE